MSELAFFRECKGEGCRGSQAVKCLRTLTMETFTLLVGISLNSPQKGENTY